MVWPRRDWRGCVGRYILAAKEVTIAIVVSDIYTDIDSHNKIAFVVLLLVAIVLQVWIGDTLMLCSDSLSAWCKDICPTLIAFSMAVYVFLWKLSDDIKQKLQTEADDKRRPVRVFFATWTLFIFCVLVLYLIALLSRKIPCPVLVVALYTFASYVIWLFIDVLLNMYAFHTFAFGLKEKPDKQNEDMKEKGDNVPTNDTKKSEKCNFSSSWIPGVIYLLIAPIVAVALWTCGFGSKVVIMNVELTCFEILSLIISYLGFAFMIFQLPKYKKK